MTEGHRLQRGRMMWLCRRGVREMDVLLGEFMRLHYDQMDQEQLANLETLLTQADLDILDWIYKRRETPQKWSGLVDMLRQQNARTG